MSSLRPPITPASIVFSPIRLGANKDFNELRLELMQGEPDMRYSEHRVIAIDDTLIDYRGKFIADVGYYWDHVEERNKIAHDYLIANYVCESRKHYPLEFRRFKKRGQCAATGEVFKDHTQMFCELVDWTHEHKILGIFAFDGYFTNAGILNHIHSKQDSTGYLRGYVGDLKFNRKLDFKGRSIKANELAVSIPPEARQELRRGDERQWYITCTLHIPNNNHKVRIVILWNQRRDAEPCKILVTNRIQCAVRRTLGVYRKRWTGTETFHRDGKHELGMGDCQLRSLVLFYFAAGATLTYLGLFEYKPPSFSLRKII